MSAPATTAASFKLPLGLVVAVLVMVGVLLLPMPADLPVAGHRMLAILAFAVNRIPIGKAASETRTYQHVTRFNV